MAARNSYGKTFVQTLSEQDYRFERIDGNPRKSGLVSAEQQLQALGIKLPALPEPFGAYTEAMQTGNLLFLWAGLSGGIS